MKQLIGLLLALGLSACAAIPTPSERADQSRSLALQAGWEPVAIGTDDFTLSAYLPRHPSHSETLTIYIEGDGLAWIDSSTPSSDPTPVDPLALKLALRDTAPSAYLARPCQFVAEKQQRNCSRKFWTSHRFAPEVIRSTNQAIDQLKRRLGVTKLTLVGYSGGGTVAALAAARRNDVARLITVAGNLAPRDWAKEHHLTPLSGSLNPADDWQQLQHIPQTHFVGGKDKVVGESVARAYAAHFPADVTPSIVVIPDFDHHCCWEESWPALKYRAETIIRKQ